MRQRRWSPSLSLSLASSHSLSSESEEEDQETKRFCTVSDEDQFDWDLPSELASYASTEFEKYIPEKSHQNLICELNQVSNNLNQFKKMYEFLKDLLKEKNENNSLAMDEILGKIHKRAFSMMAPLFKVWLSWRLPRSLTPLLYF